MIDMDKKRGPLPIRIWGLIFNFIGNAMALFGAVWYIRNGTHLIVLAGGTIITLGCVILLSIPSE